MLSRPSSDIELELNILLIGTGLNKISRPIIVRNLTNQDVLLRVKTSNPDVSYVMDRRFNSIHIESGLLLCTTIRSDSESIQSRHHIM